ncbi:hypothetical protein BD560DRAFT_382553 [Blakeslea trispora]|nr:hypothetical protein BD560DRAFT_382553 [Blakeslea trispora]
MTLHPRKSQRVYRSPSNPDDPSPYAKCASATPNESHFMDIDAEDKEAGTILMALAQHANRIRSHSTLGTIEEKPTQSRSMSIRNLLDDSNPNRASGLVSPHRSLSSGAKPFYESRRQNSLKKGIKICLAQRNTYMNEEPEEEVKPSTVYHRKNVSSVSFRHPDIVKTIMRKPTAKSIRKNTLHIHISYRIHAHITSSNSLISKVINLQYRILDSRLKV